ncbi:MAG: hypothetical protein LBT97_02980 [Planctomycetota bacterium]|jgi:hypothetical protein|nr:hypothetical protein [Planctomycetota bacterium]
MPMQKIISASPVLMESGSRGANTIEDTVFPYDADTTAYHRGGIDMGPRGPNIFNYRNYTIFGFPLAWAIDPYRGRLERVFTPRDIYSGVASYDEVALPNWYYSMGKAYSYGSTNGYIDSIAVTQRPFMVWTLDTGRVERYLIDYMPPGATTYRTFSIIGSVRDYILAVMVFSNIWRVIAISRKDPRIYRPARDVPGLDWLCDAVEKYGLSRNLTYCQVAASINSGDLSRYVYLASQATLASSSDSASQYFREVVLFLDFVNERGYQVMSGSLRGVHNALVDERGHMYIPYGFTPTILDPFERTLRTFPVGSWRDMPSGYRTENDSRSIFISESEMLVTNTASITWNSNGVRGMIVDLYNDTCTLLPPINVNSGSATTSYTAYVFHDQRGNLFLSMADPAHTGSRMSTPQLLVWLGTFGKRSVYPAAERLKSDLGGTFKRWARLSTAALGLEDDVLRAPALLNAADAESLDPLAVESVEDGNGDEGKTLKIVNGKWRKVSDLDVTYLPAPGAEREVVAIDGGDYVSFGEPRPLPDWFNGCTPVVRNGEWKAGDALYRLPLHPRRPDLSLFSRNRRWEPRALPFTYTAATLAAAFPNLLTAYPAWYVYAGGGYKHNVCETVQHVDGYSPGLIKPLPDPLIYTYGIDRAELGITGNFSNNYWTGGDIDSNRPLTLFNSVNNSGTGRWEIGDVIETRRKRLDDISDSWHYLAPLTTVNRVEDYEPSTLFGEEHRPLYEMLARFMSRMWMRGNIGQYQPARIELQASRDPDFLVEVDERDTDIDTVGWYFEHVDGGQSAFLPTGPAANTVVGVVFDPLTAGVDYDLTTHHARYRITLGAGGSASEWMTPEFIDVRDNWWTISQIENQTQVNHFVIPSLVDKGWLFSKEPIIPLGGAKIIAPVSITAGERVDWEVEVGDSILFASPRAERRSTVDGKVGFTILGEDDIEVPYPDDSMLEGEIHLVFDPAVAAVSSRVGTRFYRHRLIRDDVVGRWVYGKTATTQSNQVRLDMLNVIGSEEHRDPDGIIPMIRLADNQTIVSDEAVIPASEMPLEEGNHIHSPVPTAGSATVLAHGVYWNNTETDNLWRHNQAMQAWNRRSRLYPALYEEPVFYTRTAGPRGSTSFSVYYRLLHMNVAPYVYMRFQNANLQYPLMLDIIPGSVFVPMFEEPSIYGEYNWYVSGADCLRIAQSEDGRFFLFDTNSSRFTSSYERYHTILVYDRTLGSFSRAARFQRAGSGYGPTAFYVGDGLFHIRAVNAALEQTFLEPATMTWVEAGRVGVPVHYGPGRTYGRDYGLFAYMQGKRKFLTAHHDAYTWTRFTDLDGNAEITGYMNCNHRTTDNEPYRGPEFAGNGSLTEFFGTETLVQLYLKHGSLGRSVYMGGGANNSGGLSAVVMGRSVTSSAGSSYYACYAPSGAPGTFTKGAGYNNYPWGYSGYIGIGMGNVPAPGLCTLLVPDSTEANQSFDFMWHSPLYGETRSHNISRVGMVQTVSGGYFQLGGMGCAVWPTASGTAVANGRKFQVGDVYPAFSLLKGEYYARLAFGQHIGR